MLCRNLTSSKETTGIVCCVIWPTSFLRHDFTNARYIMIYYLIKICATRSLLMVTSIITAHRSAQLDVSTNTTVSSSINGSVSGKVPSMSVGKFHRYLAEIKPVPNNVIKLIESLIWNFLWNSKQVAHNINKWHIRSVPLVSIKRMFSAVGHSFRWVCILRYTCSVHQIVLVL